MESFHWKHYCLSKFKYNLERQYQWPDDFKTRMNPVHMQADAMMNAMVTLSDMRTATQLNATCNFWIGR